MPRSPFHFLLGRPEVFTHHHMPCRLARVNISCPFLDIACPLCYFYAHCTFSILPSIYTGCAHTTWNPCLQACPQIDNIEPGMLRLGTTFTGYEPQRRHAFPAWKEYQDIFGSNATDMILAASPIEYPLFFKNMGLPLDIQNTSKQWCAEDSGFPGCTPLLQGAENIATFFYLNYCS